MGPIGQARDAFSDIYARNTWGKGSGVGSEVEHTRDYVAALTEFMREHHIRSVVDFGCGDWQFSRTIDWSGIQYSGFDVVPAVIAANKSAFVAPNISFHLVEDGAHLPAADLLICKDVLQHLPVVEVRRYLAIFKRLYSHMLITNDVRPEDNLNIDIHPGQARPLRLDVAPFHETFDVLLTWDVDAYGYCSTKQTCHLRGATGMRPPYVKLADKSDPPAKVAAAKRALIDIVREAIKDTPLAPVARWVWRLFRPSRP